MRIAVRELSEVLGGLPDIVEVATHDFIDESEDDLFLTTLGFEERCLNIPQLLRERRYQARKAIYFQYKTNRNDNEVNLPSLLEELTAIADEVESLGADTPKFSSLLRTQLATVAPGDGRYLRVTVDISSMANRLLVRCLKVLLESDLELRILYSEAAIYHPTREEYDAHPKRWTSEEGLALERGVADVVTSVDHPGHHLDVLPNTIVVFPAFKLDRTRAVIAKVDPSLLTAAGDRVIWIVGLPRLPADRWRADAMRQINRIGQDAPEYDVSTFDYKQTLETLERIWQGRVGQSNLILSPLGSKLQGVGIALFSYLHSDVRLEFASPKEYNAAVYSEGCKAQWIIRVGSTVVVRNLLDSVGELALVDG